MSTVFSVFDLLDPPLWLVTSAAGEQRGGLIATFVNQASIVPSRPRVLVGIARQHHTWKLIEASQAFGLHLLGAEQLDWIWRFGLQSGRAVDKLADLPLGTSATGAPRLQGVLGWLDCRVSRRLETGDRTIYVGEVVEAALEKAGRPLTVQQMVTLAPPEKLQELKRQMAHDQAVDLAAMG